MCDLASSSVKSSNALTAKSQKRSKKGKRGRSSTGSLTEALKVKTHHDGRTSSGSGYFKPTRKTHGCNVGKEGG